MSGTGNDSEPASGAMKPASCAITIHGVLPPPVTGMTACTQSVINLMASRVTVFSYSWSNGAPKITHWFRISKALRAQWTPWMLLFARRAERHVFYMPSNNGFALYFNIIAFAAARIRGCRCVLHHHIYAYLERYEWRIQLLDRLLGVDGLHIVLCPHMEQQLRRRYHCRASVAIVPSAIQLLQSPIVGGETAVPPSSPPRRFCLGHLGNLSLAKGLDLAIDTLRALVSNGRDVELILAGPVYSAHEGRLIEDAEREFADRIEYRGPVYGKDKEQFFNDINAMLYPTLADAQPLVITESFGFGRPVLSYARGCIPAMIGSKTDWSISGDDDYVARAVPQIEKWIDDPSSFDEACRFARQRYSELLEDANRAFDEFVLWVRGEAPAGFAHRERENGDGRPQ